MPERQRLAVILVGNLTDGYSAIGPFPSALSALDYAERYTSPDSPNRVRKRFWIMYMSPPLDRNDDALA